MRTLTEQIAPDLAANAQALKNMLVHDLLRGVALDESTHLQQARKLGLDLNRPRVVILIDASHYISGQDASLSWSTPRQGVTRQRVAMALDLVGRHFRDTSEAIWAYTGDGEIAVLPACAHEDLAPWAGNGSTHYAAQPHDAHHDALQRCASELLAKIRQAAGSEMHAGIGRYHLGPAALTQSYRDARMAVTLGPSLSPGGSIHSLYSVALPAFLGNSETRTKATLARLILAPLEPAPELMETLRVFFEEDHYHSTSALRLNIHRNTLACRLEKIAQLTGLDPRKHIDSLQLALSLHLLPTSAIALAG